MKNMRIGKPQIGYGNMRKVTSNEAKLLGVDKKLMVKIWIMTGDFGEISYWLINGRSTEVTKFTGTEYEYFDNRRASLRLEQYWSTFSAKVHQNPASSSF